MSSGRAASSSGPRDGGDGPSTSRASGHGDSRGAGPGPGAPRGGGAGGGGGGQSERRRNGERYDIVHTRPADVVSKQGKDGTPIQLLSNYYRVKTKPQWRIEHYHVDFKPEVEVLRVRCGILSEHAAILGKGYLFDGKQLFTTKKFEQDVTVLQGKSKQDIDYTITIKCVGFISAVEPRFLQVLNLILRRSMKGLNLELVGRNLFDPHARV